MGQGHEVPNTQVMSCLQHGFRLGRGFKRSGESMSVLCNALTDCNVSVDASGSTAAHTQKRGGDCPFLLYRLANFETPNDHHPISLLQTGIPVSASVVLAGCSLERPCVKSMQFSSGCVFL